MIWSLGPAITPYGATVRSRSNITQINSFISKHSRIRRARLPAKSSSKIGVARKKTRRLQKGTESGATCSKTCIHLRANEDFRFAPGSLDFARDDEQGATTPLDFRASGPR